MLPAPRAASRPGAAILLAALCAAAVVASSCGSSTATSIAGPTPPRCQVTIAGTPSTFPPAGGSGTVQVATDRDCTWSATSGASWIALSGSTSGQGNGSFPFSVAVNAVVAARSASIAVNGQNFAVSQQPAACTFSVSPPAVPAAVSGGTAVVSVQSQSGCAWTATSNASWISIAGGGTGNGNGTVQLAIAANTGGARSGTVTAAGQTVTVNQSAVPTPPPTPSCSFAIAPTSLSVPATGGSGTVSVTTASSCSWTATSPVPWVTIAAGSAGTGSGSVTFAVAANTGGARSTSLSIAGHTFTISQASDPGPACSYSISPTSQSFTEAGGTGSVSVKTAGNCSWTATSGASWVTITSGSSDTGNGSVRFAVDANTGAARSTTLTIAGQTFSVSQAGAALACTYSISPNGSVTVPASGGTLPISVSTASGCAWTAVVSDSWMSIQSGATGSGPGSVVVAVSVNTGGRRNGYAAVEGKQLAIHQSAAAALAAMQDAELPGSSRIAARAALLIR